MTSLANPIKSSVALDHFEHGINRVVISSDERFVATSDVDMNVVVQQGSIVVYSNNFGSQNDKIRPTERVRGLAFSPSGETFYVAAGDQVLALSTEDWSLAWSYEAPRSFGFLIISPITLDVAANGDVAVAFDNGSMVVWDRNGVKKQIIKDNDSPRWMRFVADGAKIVGSDSFSLCSWDLHNRKRKLKTGLTGRVYAMDVERLGRVAATRTLQDVVLWDVINQEILCVMPVSPGVPVLAFHPHLDLLAFCERSKVSIVNFEGARVQEFDMQVTSGLSMSFTPSGSELLVGCTERQVVRLNVRAD